VAIVTSSYLGKHRFSALSQRRLNDARIEIWRVRVMRLFRRFAEFPWLHGYFTVAVCLDHLQILGEGGRNCSEPHLGAHIRNSEVGPNQTGP